MNAFDALSLLDNILAQKANYRGLNDLQESIFRLCWEKRSYADIAQTLGYDSDYIKKAGGQLWKLLSLHLEKTVSKKNIHSVLRKLESPSIPTTQDTFEAIQDWGDAINGQDFWGRESELNKLKSWIKGDHCHVISILGQGGIGKTALAVQLAEQVQDQFQVLIWRSLRQAPLCSELLAEILGALPPIAETIPKTLEEQVSYLIQYLDSYRCFLAFDNLEVILQQGKAGGQYREGYQSYQHLLERLCDGRHSSCVVITSREKPDGLSIREGELLTVRSLRLQGLSQEASLQLLKAKGLNANPTDSEQIVNKYGGNPLAMKVVASTIHSIFGGNTSFFLDHSVTVLPNIWDLLQQQLKRLSVLETQVMYWLAINREPIHLVDLQEDLFPKVPQRDLIIALTSLQERSLIEPLPTGLTQQSVVMEFMTEHLIHALEDEFAKQDFEIFKSHAVLKAQTKDYIRETQKRLIVKPLLERLLDSHGHLNTLEQQLRDSLFKLRHQPLKNVGYAGGNLLNLLSQTQPDFTGEDLSELILWQAYLPHTNLSQVNLSQSNLEKSVFAEAFGGITAIAFSPDGHLLATGDTTGGINLWQVRTGKKITILEGHKFWIWALQFSPDSSMLLSTGDDYLVKVWDITSEECIKVFEGHELSVVSGIWHPNGQIIASSSQDETIRIWQLFSQNRDCIHILRGHRNRVWSICFSPNGQIIASGAEDNTIKLWNSSDGKCLNTLEGHENWVKTVAFSPDGKILTSGSFDKTIKIWDVKTGKCVNTLKGHSNTVTAVVFRPDGLRLVSSSYDQTLKVWDSLNGQCLNTLRGHTNRIWTVTYAPDGSQIVSGGDDHAAKFWIEKTGQCSQTLQGHTNLTLSVDINPNLTCFASGHEDQTIRIWDYTTGKLQTTLWGHTNRVWSVAFSPLNSPALALSQTKVLASGSADGSVHIWEYETGKRLHQLLGHKSWVWCIAFSPNGQWLASSSYDQTIKLWDVHTGNCLQTFHGHKGPVSSVTFSPNGDELVSSSFDYSIKRWSVESGKCLDTFEGHTNNVWSTAFSPDGSVLVSSSYDSSIKVWDYSSGQCTQTLQGHQGPVVPIRFLPDGKSILTGSYDRTLKHWDLETGQCLTTLVGHTDVVVSLTFSQDSLPKLISGSFDETIRIWNLDTGCCLETLRVPRPYEGMNISNVTGLTNAQKETLKVLGAMDTGNTIL